MSSKTWTSRRKYRTPKGTGQVIIMGDGAVVLVHGQKFPVPHEFAEGIQKLESKFADAGRPELFPGKDTSTHGITLPAELWARLPRPFSAAIAELVETHLAPVPFLVTTEGE